MTLDLATQDIAYNKSADETFLDVQKALSIIGKVKNTDKITLTIEGTSKYGLQSVKLKVKNPQRKTSIISISGFSDDVWAAGAKNCMKCLIETMNNLDNPDYKPSKTGVEPMNMTLRLVGFIVASVLVAAIITWGNLLVVCGVVLLGFVVLVYFIIARMRFGKK